MRIVDLSWWMTVADINNEIDWAKKELGDDVMVVYEPCAMREDDIIGTLRILVPGSLIYPNENH